MLRLLVFLCCFSPLTLLAQSTTGTQFWLGYMENLDLAFNDAPVFTIVVNSATPTTGTIEVPTTGLSIPFSVNAGSTEIELPTAIFYSEGSDQVDNKGILITAVEPISVQAYHYRAYFSESTSLLPASELGSEYLVTTILYESAFSPSSLVIVATEDNTPIEITPAALTLGLFPAGNPYTITLNRGQNYQIQSLGDLAGTRVRSLNGEPLAVFGGARQANIGLCSGGADSHVWDQSLPVEQWSDLYYFVPFSGQGSDVVRILTTEDDTDIFLDCELLVSLDAGEYFTTDIGVAGVISATGPISLTQYNNSQSCNPSDLGDPNGLSYFPAERLSTEVRWLASGRANLLSEGGSYFLHHFVNVLAPTANISTIELDGNPLVGFSPFAANPNWSYVQIEIDAGEHQLESEAPFQAYSYGFGGFDAYTQNLGYTELVPTDFTCLEIEADGLFCADTLLQFTYQSNLELVNFAWNFGDNTTSALPEPQHAYLTPGTYTVSLTAIDTEGTEVTATLDVTLADCGLPCTDLPPLIINFEEQICVNEIVQFIVENNIEIVEYQWETINQSGSNSDFFTSFSEEGLYEVALNATDVDGCTYEEVVTITAVPCNDPCEDLPALELVFEQFPCEQEVVSFSLSTTASLNEVSWLLNGEVVSQGVTWEWDAGFPGTYFVQVMATDENGCSYEVLEEVFVTECVSSPGCQLMLPNIFSPNLDGTNDHFRAFFAEECQPDFFSLKVFNRWGVLVYESTDSTQAWDGTVNGKRHPAAVLVYWCQFSFPGREVEELKGDVTLVR